jgi:CDP-2,3-bis-(O-geranylgeranyl)-sn-glycerol synthase
MAPAYLANMAPPFVRYWRGWNRPVNQALFGAHKTWMGFGLGVGAAVLTAGLQAAVDWPGAIADYGRWLTLGLLFGTGAMVGDLLKSFFKRRVGIEPGRPWVPFDQCDFVLGALVFTGRRAELSAWDVVLIVGLSALGHVVVNHAGYWLGVRPSRW